MSLSLLSPVFDRDRKDYEVSDTTLVNPSTTNSFEMGEWVTFSSGLLTRIGASSVKNAYQIFSQRGDVSVQALGKLAVIENNDYTAETDMMKDSGAGWTEQGYLTVKDASLSGVTRSVLTQATQGTDYVYAVLLVAPADNGGLLRFRRVSPFFWAT